MMRTPWEAHAGGPPRLPGRAAASWTRSATGRQRGVDVVERRVGALAEGGDRPDADDDNEGEHDGVLDGRRAVLGLHELDDGLGELTHETLLGASKGNTPSGKTLDQLPAG